MRRVCLFLDPPLLREPEAMLDATPNEETHKCMPDEKNEKLRQEVHAQFETILDEKLMEECE